jgi:ribonuclease III
MPRTSLRYDRIDFESQVDSLLNFLQIIPRDRDHYLYACTHRSVLNESSIGYSESNERLEFLGDAVLELIVTEKLFAEFADKTE